ncbi:hypothetical protein GGF31_003617 [Allomyces arbusculus]|nr:hypothetical protein GGF31_003617 [Allomyces arbusculus]
MPRPPPARDPRDAPRVVPAPVDALPAAMAAAASASATTTPRAPPPPYDATMHDRLAAWLRDHDARLRAQVDRLNDDDDEDLHDALNHYDDHDGGDDLSDSSSASGSDLTLAMMRSAQPYTPSGMTRDVLVREDEDGVLEAVVLHPALAYSSDEEGGDSDLEVPVSGPRNTVPGNVYRGASAANAVARAVSPALSSDDDVEARVESAAHAHRHQHHHHHRHHHQHEQAPAALATTTAAAAQPTDARARDVVDMMRQLRRELDYVSSVMADHLPAPGNATGRASPGQLPAAVPVPDLLTPSTDTLPEYEPLADTTTQQQRPAVRLRSTLAAAIAARPADPVRTHATGSSSASASGAQALASPTARHSWAAPAAAAAAAAGAGPTVGPRVRSAVSHAPRPKSMSVVPDPRTVPLSSASSSGGPSALGFRATDDPMPMTAARARAQSTSALDAPDAVKPVIGKDEGKGGDVTKPWTRPTAAAGVSAAAVEDLLRCFICLGQLNKAVMCPNCSKMACEGCLKKWITEQKRECPHCRTHLFVSQLVQCRFVDDLQQQLKEMIEAPNAVESVDVCSAHHAPLHYYCVTCSDAICSDCAMFDERHRGHAFQHLEKVYVAHRDRVMAEADRLDAEIGRQKVAAEQVAEKMAGLRDAQRKMEEDLQVVLAQALHDVEAQVHDQMMRLFHEKSVYEEHAQHLADTSAAVRAAASSSSRAALIAQADRLVAQLHDAEHAFLGAAVPADALAGATPDVPALVSPLVPAYTAVDVPLHAFSTYAQTGQVFYSAAFMANALSWRLKVYPTGNGAARGESLSVFVELVDGLPAGASADVQFKLAVMVPATAHATNVKAAAAAASTVGISSKADLDTDFTTTSPGNTTRSSVPLVEGASRELATTFARGECWGCSELVPLAHLRDGAYLTDNDTLHLRFAVRAPSYAHQCALLDRQVAALQAEVASLRQANAAANATAAAAAAASKPVAVSPRVARLAIATAPKVVANKTGTGGSMSAPPSPGLRVRSATAEGGAGVASRRATAPLAKAASVVEVGSGTRNSARSVTGAHVKTKSWPAPSASPTAVTTAATGRTRSPSWTLSTSPKVRTRTTTDSSVSATHARFRPLSAVFNTLELEAQDDHSGASDLDDDDDDDGNDSDSDSIASGSDDTATLARVVRAPPTATTLSASSGSDTASVVRDREAARLPPPLAPVPRHSTGRYAQAPPAPASPRVIVAAAGLTIPDASLSDTEEGVSARASSPLVTAAAVPVVATQATGGTAVMPRVKTSATGGSAASMRGAPAAAGTGSNAGAAATAPVV